jgi:hypothetical protein
LAGNPSAKRRVDAVQQDHLDAVHLRHGVEPGAERIPDESVRRGEIGQRRGGWREAVEGSGDARERVRDRQGGADEIIGHGDRAPADGFRPMHQRAA